MLLQSKKIIVAYKAGTKINENSVSFARAYLFFSNKKAVGKTFTRKVDIALTAFSIPLILSIMAVIFNIFMMLFYPKPIREYNDFYSLDKKGQRVLFRV